MANWKEIYARAEDRHLEMLRKLVEQQKTAQSQKTPSQDGVCVSEAVSARNMQWYEILIQDKFVDFFKNHNTEVLASANGKDAAHPLFEEFRGIVLGMTMACSLGDQNRKQISESLAKTSPHEAVGYDHFLDTCPNGERRFADIWNSMQDPYETDVESLSAEQIAVLILYPFWSRMGGNFEEEFAKDGRLGRYLCLLKKKILKQDPAINGLIDLCVVKHPDLKKVDAHIRDNQMSAEEVTYAAIRVSEKGEYEIVDHIYRFDCWPEQEDLLTNEWVGLFDVFIDHGLDANMVFPAGGPDNDNIMWSLHTIQNGDIGPTILRNLLQKNGDPNTVVLGTNFFQDMDWDLLWDVREGTEKWLFDIHFHFWLVLMGFGGYINDHQCPVKLKDGYSVEMFREFERFDYRITHEGGDWTMHIFIKDTGEEVATL